MLVTLALGALVLIATLLILFGATQARKRQDAQANPPGEPIRHAQDRAR